MLAVEQGIRLDGGAVYFGFAGDREHPATGLRLNGFRRRRGRRCGRRVRALPDCAGSGVGLRVRRLGTGKRGARTEHEDDRWFDGTQRHAQAPRNEGGGGGISKVLRLSSSSSEKISPLMSSSASSSLTTPSSRLVSAKRSASTPRNCHNSFTASGCSLRRISKNSARRITISSLLPSERTVAERGWLRTSAISPK